VAEEANSVSEDEEVEALQAASDDDDGDDEDFVAHVFVRP
jgi:hypothetical protein